MSLKKNNNALPMLLTEQELLQIDEAFIRRLCDKNPDALAGLSINLVNDLKEALERLNQNPTNSSKPSGSCAPWDKNHDNDDDSPVADIADEHSSADDTPHKATGTATPESVAEADQKQSRQPGRQPGSQGFGRTLKARGNG